LWGGGVWAAGFGPATAGPARDDDVTEAAAVNGKQARTETGPSGRGGPWSA